MRHELWPEVESALAAALEQPAAERLDWVAQACADPEVRAEVESLLRVYSRAEDFLTPGGETHLNVGAQLGPYEILWLIGAGGMGEVYRARDPRIGREVAIKVLPARFAADPVRLRRFSLEVRAAGSLNHANILAIYDVGTHAGVPYLVTELLQGETLGSRLKRGALPLPKAIEFALGIANGLAAAHAKGIIHRDLKPENVFIGEKGQVKILDFGLARLTEREQADTQETDTAPGMILGTAAYMSPEQVRGEPCDHRSDIFSLGSILFEMLSGKKAFPGDSHVEIMSAVLKADPPDPAVSASLLRVLRRCLEKNRGERFQSASDLAFYIESFLRIPEKHAGPNLLQGLETGALAGKRSVAVLPFKLLTPTSEDAYLSVALADAVINQLSASDQLLLRPTAAVLKYAKENTHPFDAGRELNVQVVVEGSIQKFGERLRVHVQAWNANDGSTLLSTKHDSGIADLFPLQDSIADELARALGSKPRTQVTAVSRPRNPLAYELLLRGVERLSRWNRWDTRTAIEMLEEAVRLDASFTDAWAKLAEAYRQMEVTFEPGAQWILRAEKAVRRALTLDRNSAEAQCVRGRILWTPAKGFQNRAALRALSNALKLNPGCHQAQVEKGCILFHVGLHDEAEGMLRAALTVNSEDATALAYMALTLVYRGDYDQADYYQARALSIDPTNLWANLFGAMVPVYRDQMDLADKHIRAATQFLPKDPMLAGLEALLWAKRGERRKATQALMQALRVGQSVAHTHHILHIAAAAYSALGKRREALALLRKASRTGLPNYPLFRDDPHFERLRPDQPFARLLADLKRQWQGYRREFGP